MLQKIMFNLFKTDFFIGIDIIIFSVNVSTLFINDRLP